MDRKKEQRAIEVLRAFEPQTEPYYLCYSGGKDSDCIRILAQLAGVKHDLVHNLTTVDAPETIKYIKSIPDVIINKSRDKYGKHVTMWSLIVKKGMPPTRLMRYCCSELKEKGGYGRLKITGVRKAESRNRTINGGLVKILKKPVTVQKIADNFGADYDVSFKGGTVMNMDNDPERRTVEHCYRTTSTMINPIIDWSDDDVWEFLHHYGCLSNPLYQCGRKRIGCIGCPLSGEKRMKEEFEKYPKYKEAYIHAFDRMLKGKTTPTTWESGLDVYKWWIGEDPNQLSFFE